MGSEYLSDHTCLANIDLFARLLSIYFTNAKGSFINDVFFERRYYTVKPMYNDNPGDPKFVAIVDR